MLSFCTAKERSLQTLMLSERKSKRKPIGLPAATKAFQLCPLIYEYILHVVRTVIIEWLFEQDIIGYVRICSHIFAASVISGWQKSMGTSEYGMAVQESRNDSQISDIVICDQICENQPCPRNLHLVGY